MTTEIIDRHECPGMKLSYMISPEGLDDGYFECSAIYDIVRSNRSGWLAVGDGRGSSIFFCPFCGKRLV